MNNQIHIRLNSLKLALDEINEAFQETLKDPLVDVGLEREKSYPLDEVHEPLFKQADFIENQRKEILYYRIFCFTQVVYSLKEYLKKTYPSKMPIIESFFSDSFDGEVPKKQMGIDLKHNPKSDMKFGLVIKSQKTETVNRTQTTTYYYNFNWSYQGKDSIDLCKKVFEEIHQFINEDLHLPKQ